MLAPLLVKLVLVKVLSSPPVSLRVNASVPVNVIVPEPAEPGGGELVIAIGIETVKLVVSVDGGTVVLVRRISATLTVDPPLRMPELLTGANVTVDPDKVPKVSVAGLGVAV
jgi:hypothetical protein